MPQRTPSVVLSFGLVDPTGASGALADALGVAAMGCHLAAVTTCIAVQDTRERSDLFVIDEELVDDQARAVLQDMPVAAIKIGALGSTDNAQAIGAILADYDDLPVVLDPRLDLPSAGPDAGEGGADSAAAEIAVAMRELLLPQTTVLTLNLRQARRLVTLAGADEQVGDADDWTAVQCAQRLMRWGAASVLVTAASSQGGQVINTLFGPDELQQNESLDARDHAFTGAGDTLSAALSALLAQGIDLGDAVREANEYLAGALAAGYRVGMGDAVPDRLFWASDEDAADAADAAAASDPTEGAAALVAGVDQRRDPAVDPPVATIVRAAQRR